MFLQAQRQSLVNRGLTDNNALMLSLTTIDGAPINAPKQGHDSDEYLLYEPTTPQLKEINGIVDKRDTRHPIIQLQAN